MLLQRYLFCGAALLMAAMAGGAEAAVSNAAGPGAGATGTAFRENFNNPPARFRIMKIIHQLPPTPAGEYELLETLTRQGFGGLVTNVPFKNYLRDEAGWAAFTRTVTEAKKRGMAMWLYDEKGYPSGNAGGLTMEGHPEWEARGIYFADAASQGGPVTLELPPGKLLGVAAYPVKDGAIELDRAVDLGGQAQGGKLAWTAPAGAWRVIAMSESNLYENTHASANLFAHTPYINHLIPEPTARFIQLTHQAYADHLNNELGKYFIATFTDEPSLMSFFLKPSPWRVVPWSQTFSAEFKKRRGYALEPLLPALACEAGARTGRTRYDFWLTVSELEAQNYFGQIRDWCRAHGIPSGGHLLFEEPLLAQVASYGDLFRCEKMLDAPSLDCLTSLPPQVNWYAARLVSSAGELTGHYDNMCETSDHAQRYRPAGDTRPIVPISEAQIRGTCNRLIAAGMTGITSYYSFAGLSDDALRRLNQWIGRCAGSLYGGHQAADVALVYPIESAWTHFEPSHHTSKDAPEAAQRIERGYRWIADQLFFHQRDYTVIDAQTLCEGKAEAGVFKYRNLAWRAIVLPCVDTLPLKAWANLAAFRKGGGIVIAVGSRPMNSESEFPSPAVERLGKEILPEGAGKSGGVYLPLEENGKISMVLDGLLAPQVKVTPAGITILATHRRIGGNEVYFLVNDSDKPWAGEASLAAAGKGEQYDPGTGAAAELKSAEKIALKLEPYGAAIFRFDAAQAEKGKAAK